MLRLCTVTIVATPLNFSHEEKAVTVRSHGVEHAVDLLAAAIDRAAVACS